MNSLTDENREVFLTALAPSHQVRTARYSQENLKAFLKERPTAITLSSGGMFDAEVLIGYSSAIEELLHRRRLMNRTDGEFTIIRIAQAAEASRKLTIQMSRESVVTVLQDTDRLVHRVIGKVFLALVPDFHGTPEDESKFRLIFSNLLTRRLRTDNPPPVVEESTREIPKKERHLLIQLRREMLEKVGTLSSEDLATAAESITSNSSQYAADQRSAGAIFGVKFGKEWRYPAFQFDAKRRVRSEMKTVLAALAPDDQGWDRLQWFLTPHEVLGGKTPLVLWQKSPLKVIEAANTERWNGRD
jgi:hypothetical protein